MMSTLSVGDPAPWFISQPIATSAPDLTVGGYRSVLFFFGSASNPQIQPIVASFLRAKAQLQQAGITFLGVSIDPNDRQLEAQVQPSESFRWLWDLDGDLSIRYGVCQLDETGGIAYDPTTFILDENLRVLAVIPLETHRQHVDRVLSVVKNLPQPEPPRQIKQVAPALFVPNVLSPEFCQQLIQLYRADGGTESGVMRSQGNQVQVAIDRNLKRRRDWMVTDAQLLEQINAYIGRRVRPEVEKAFQYRISHFERYLVACYDDQSQGFFSRHRDNTNVGMIHRRFAMTLNLNDGYEGGCLRFPEYGTDLYSPEPGGAVLFSCSLLHEVTPVTRGTRFVLLSFFYGEMEAQFREQTLQKIQREGGSGVDFAAGNLPIDPVKGEK
ncbi:2OG-Fe(II) oxygenase [Egbenema bharatensis]|uniref:2OG-Fe(II) oxygenase n=1 Tax=Egbenema bharatensis TaxID=3463334 RepID=UPI003A85C0CB